MSTTFATSNKPVEKVRVTKRTNIDINNFFMEHRETNKSHNEILMSTTGQAYNVECLNGLIGTVVYAYNKHHNIILRPEDFWCAVMTQFSLYMEKYAEQLRNTFVDFAGEKELEVTIIGNLHNAPYDQFTQLMSDQIAANIKDPSIRDWVIPAFTTSTNTDRTVFSVILMASMQKYFSYTCHLECGIPNVTLLGTTEDYENLAKRVDRLLEFDCGTGLMVKWHKYLAPIFAELIRCTKLSPNKDFWAKICSDIGGGSGPTYLSGWITAFTCFDEKGTWKGDNLSVEVWDEYISSEYPIVDTNDIAPGLVSVPVLVIDNDKEYNTTMFSGSAAANLVNDTTLAPRLDWCIALKK